MRLGAEPIEPDALAASATMKAALASPVFRDRLVPILTVE
jgi:hypothetical protein